MQRFIPILFAAVVLTLPLAASAAPKQPNLVIIMADDLGYADLGCYGHPSIRTPNIDRMAAEGLRFTDFYASACVCTPSRAGLLTGRLPIRSGMAGSSSRHVLYPNSTGGLPQQEITLARALKDHGYTTACIGKWHLGAQPPFMPNQHGFDLYFGLPYSNDMDALSAKQRTADSTSAKPRWQNFNVPLLRNGDIVERPADQTTLTKRYTEEAVQFIRENRRKPFLLYVPHTFPHVPLFASDEFLGQSLRGLYGDTAEEIDWSVGRILETLRKEGLSKRTLVVFISDNGPWITKRLVGGSAGLLRDGKGGTWEGGYRVPGIAWWPGSIKPGRVTSELASNLDLFATCLKLAGATLPTDRPIDGVDLAPLLLGKGNSPRQMIHYYYGTNLYALRQGHFKAHFTTHDGYSKEPPVQHNPPLLFNLAQDPSETQDVAAAHPDVVAAIRRAAEQHNATLVPGAPQF